MSLPERALVGGTLHSSLLCVEILCMTCMLGDPEKKLMVAKAISAPSSTAFWSRKKTKQLLLALTFLAPALLILLIFMAKPVTDAILLSFQSWDGMRPPVWIGLTNYGNL